MELSKQQKKTGISNIQNGTERLKRTERPGKFMHCLVTANVCVPTVCSTHTVAFKLQKSVMGIQESCKLNDCILGRSVRQRRHVPVAKRVHRLTMLWHKRATGEGYTVKCVQC